MKKPKCSRRGSMNGKGNTTRIGAVELELSPNAVGVLRLVASDLGMEGTEGYGRILSAWIEEMAILHQ